ncbi:MAG: sugar ABC transporter permease, partial [Eubacteriales bacterium]|nr:sugar ABC transporter permease [Eubacteriales bacterium]
FAEMLSRPVLGGKVFRGIIFFPFIMNGVAVALIFRMFFTPSGGMDVMLSALGLQSLSRLWITNSATVNYVLSFIFVWKNIGYSFLIYLGVLQSVPHDYYEAATIDGANVWQQFKAITMPSIKPMIGLMGTLTIINSISVYDIPYVLTKGNNGTHTFVTLLTITAFKNNRYGQACAMAILILIIAMLVMLAKTTFFKEEQDVSL